MPIMYVLCEIDYDDSWYDFIMASPDLGLLQDICLALFQEQDYESYLNDVFYDKKNIAGTINFILLTKPGECIIHKITEEEIRKWLS